MQRARLRIVRDGHRPHARRVRATRRRSVAVRRDRLSERGRRSPGRLSAHRCGAIPPSQPEALLVVSAHWEEPVPTVMTSEHPPILYDYYGFPPESYEITWPAPGAPALASRVRTLLDAAGIANDADGAARLRPRHLHPAQADVSEGRRAGGAVVAEAWTRSGRAPRDWPCAGAAARRGRVHHRQRDDVPQPAGVSRSASRAGRRSVRCMAARRDGAGRRPSGAGGWSNGRPRRLRARRIRAKSICCR